MRTSHLELKEGESLALSYLNTTPRFPRLNAEHRQAGNAARCNNYYSIYIRKYLVESTGPESKVHASWLEPA